MCVPPGHTTACLNCLIEEIVIVGVRNNWKNDPIKKVRPIIQSPEMHLQSGPNLGDPGRNGNQVKSKPRQLCK